MDYGAAKDWKGAAMAVVFQATVVEAAPSGQVEAAGHVKIFPRQLSRDSGPPVGSARPPVA
jgi:hypothetical protein